MAMNQFENKYLTIARTYLTEHILCTLLTILVYLVFNSNQIANFVKLTSDGFIKSIFVPALAAVLAFLWTFYNKADGKFAVWLQTKGAFTFYLYAFAITVAYQILGILFLLISTAVVNSILTVFAVYFGFLALTSFATFVISVVGLCKLCIAYFHINNEK
jgi:hypothetical protein